MLSKISARTLFIVATPLGNPDDFSPHAKYILENVNLILAEDTRRTQNLCRYCQINIKKIISFHEHNEEERQAEILAYLQKGDSLALVSDAGTPLISDPGYRLVRACRKANFSVKAIPGASAVTTALSVAGLPPIPYTFLGFLPRNLNDCQKLFTDLARMPGSLVFFERKDRLPQSLQIIYQCLGQREFAICRELTKEFEEVILGNLESDLNLAENLLGEITVIIGPASSKASIKNRASEEDALEILAQELAKGIKPKIAIKNILSHLPNWHSKELYALIEKIKTNTYIE